MFLADPILASVIDTYLEQNIVLLDCVNSPCDVIDVLWSEKNEGFFFSPLWQKFQEWKFFKSSEILFGLWKPASALRQSLHIIFVLCLFPLFLFLAFLFSTNCRWSPFDCDSVFLDASSCPFLGYLCLKLFSQLYYVLFLEEVR